MEAGGAKEKFSGMHIPYQPENGYQINAFSGDSILPVISSLGDTIRSGKKIVLHGTRFHPENGVRPAKVKAKKPVGTSVSEDHTFLPVDLKRTLLNKDSLIAYRSEMNGVENALINSIGDTIQRGIPIKTKGRKVLLKQPLPTKALAPVFKDDATVNMRYLDVNQGMNSSAVWAITEDHNNKLWFGTDGGGLSCYDGESFYHYTEKEGLANNIVISLLADSKGNVWIGSYGDGVGCYDGDSLLYFDDKNGLIDNNIWSIIEDSKGNIWIGSDKGISKYDGESITNYTEYEGLSGSKVLTISEDKLGNIWFSTFNYGVSKFDGTSFIHYGPPQGLNSMNIFSVCCTENGSLWFGTDNSGVFFFDGETFTQYGKDQGLPLKFIWSIIEDKKGNMWFASQYDGVYRFDGTSFKNFSEKEGLSNNFIRSLHEDSKGNIWIGSDFGGVNRYVDDSFIHFSEKEGLSSNVSSSIIEDSEGNIWIAHYGFGLSIYDGSHFFKLTQEQGLMDDYLRHIEYGSDGVLWLASYYGLSSYDGNDFTYYRPPSDIPFQQINCLLEDRNKNLWIGTYDKGISCKTGDSFIHFGAKEGFNSAKVNYLMEDEKGKIWIGTANGIAVYSDSSFTYITEKEGLSNNEINSIVEDQKGRIWIGTQKGGLNYFDGTSFTYISEKDGLTNNAIQSITMDKEGSMWVATEKGISRITSFEPDQDNTKDSIIPLKFNIKNFLQSDGLMGIDFKINANLKDRQGRLWFGNIKGISMLNESDVSPKLKEAPLVRLSDIKINEKFIDYRTYSESDQDSIRFSGIEIFENYPLDLELDHQLNHLNFHFSAIDWAAPHAIQYSYRLLGLNNTWSEATKENQADYRNIPYGEFTFQVRAIGENGEWSEPFAYSFTIHPPWWQSWAARISYLLLAILSVLAYVRWRTAKLKERQKELEIEVENATHEIKKQHKEITDSIAYARRIQYAMLPHNKVLKEYLKDSFILYKPKDVVAGDFYWMRQVEGKTLFAAADCTGHGVPGALVSVVCNNALNRSVREYGLTDPGLILDKAREIVVEEFEKSEDDVKDGMDIALCCLEGNNLRFSGAHNPLWILRNKEILETKSNKQPVGKFSYSESFTSHSFELEKGDLIYIFTDGFVDQFGGESGKKFKIAAFRKLILEIESLEMEVQRKYLDDFFETWRGELEQVDDVCVIGVRVG